VEQVLILCPEIEGNDSIKLIFTIILYALYSCRTKSKKTYAL